MQTKRSTQCNCQTLLSTPTTTPYAIKQYTYSEDCSTIQSVSSKQLYLSHGILYSSKTPRPVAPQKNLSILACCTTPNQETPRFHPKSSCCIQSQLSRSRKVHLRPFASHFIHTLHTCSARNCCTSDYTIHLPGNKITDQTKSDQTSSDTEEPCQIALVLLPRDPDVHTPHSGNDIHRKDDRSEDGEFAQYVGVGLGAFVHSDVDLGDVIAMRSGEETIK